MTKILFIVCLICGVGISVFLFPNGMGAVLLCVISSLILTTILLRFTENKNFLVQVFLIALLLRIFVGTIIYIFGVTNFFAGDAYTYDLLGNTLLDIWKGSPPNDPFLVERATATDGPGWGMHYIVATIYLIFGRNELATQFFSATIGAATAPAVYICANKIFNNQRVAKLSALITAIFPSLVLWSCQLLKDGFIIFLLVVIMITVIQLQEKFNYFSLFSLILALFGILSLRFYIFYMVAIAVVGSFLIGIGSSSPQAVIRRLIALVLVGIGLTYLGVLRNANVEIEKYANLERIQASRINLARYAESGFGEDLDVSTTEGAISALPVGFTYLMLAPFPWQLTNLRQAITLPEMLVWWSCLPLLVSGLWYTIKNRLRNAIAILLFTLMLTVAYSIFQGNVGTAYRQRAQIQVFLFIFISVGWSLMQERKENQRLLRHNSNRKFNK